MRRSIVVTVALAVLAATMGPTPSSSASPSPVVAPLDSSASVLISVTDLGRAGDADLLAHDLELSYGTDIRITTALDGLDVIAAEVTPAGAAALSRIPYVKGVESSRKFSALLDLSVPAVGGTALQSAGLTGNGKIVVVIDSGVDGAAAGLFGSVVGEACFVPTTAAEAAVLVEGCPAGSEGPGAAAPCVSLPAAVCSHGTHVAGVISGAGPVYTGVAPDAGILAIRVFGVINGAAGPESIVPEVGVLQALEYVYDRAATAPIVAVNLSLGAEPGTCVSAVWTDVVSRLAAEGVAVVAASGNDGWGANFGTDAISFPACLPGVISVGATTDAGTIAPYTNSSELLDLVAPGDRIMSTVPMSVSATGYAEYSGTSFASPHVAAAFALLDDRWSGLSVARRRNLLRVAGSMVTRTTPQSGDRELRIPELQLADLADFVPFADAVGDSFWVVPADWARYRGISDGFDGVNFGAEASLDRAQAVVLLWRLMGSPDVAVDVPFDDVESGSFYEMAVKWAWSNKITTGTGNGMFSPELAVTRRQVATFMWRMVGKPVSVSTSNFGDVPLDGPLRAAIDWMAGSRITEGTSPQTFSPEWVIDRAQMITFMFRLVSSPEAWTGTVAPPAAIVLF